MHSTGVGLNRELAAADMRFFITLAIIFVVSCGENRANPARAITSDEAVSIAQSFVRANGYTTHRPGRFETLAAEPIEFLPEDQWREFRHDTLVPRAYGYVRGRKRGEPGWTVVFAHRRPDALGLGRAVTMSRDGTEVQIEHESFILTAVEVTLPRTGG